MLQDELFDTTEASPLFAGIPVPATHDERRGRQPGFYQPALCCSGCGSQEGQFLLASDGRRYCVACARILLER